MTGRVSQDNPLLPDPIAQFDVWYRRVCESGDYRYPDAVCFSTMDSEGYPSGRIMLLKSHDAQGFVVYTNLNSYKGRCVATHPKAAMTFFWPTFEWQVRIQGDTELVSDELSDAYFASRHRLSQIGAWASAQSSVIPDRAHLTAQVQQYMHQFEDQSMIPRPSNWKGILLKPRTIEFWMEGEYRLHDRFLYRREADTWRVERLSP